RLINKYNQKNVVNHVNSILSNSAILCNHNNIYSAKLSNSTILNVPYSISFQYSQFRQFFNVI
ncbi:hypothetical protein GIB67_003290, partial [Kingdonia uniflora]